MLLPFPKRIPEERVCIQEFAGERIGDQFVLGGAGNEQVGPVEFIHSHVSPTNFEDKKVCFGRYHKVRRQDTVLEMAALSKKVVFRRLVNEIDVGCDRIKAQESF